jgi:protein SCO1/2
MRLLPFSQIANGFPSFRRTRKARLTFILLAASLCLAGCLPQPLSATTAHGVVYDNSQVQADFTLTSDRGPAHLSDWRNKAVVLSFGYTYCPDVCPTILSQYKKAIGQLGSQASQVQFVFLSVDPDRDTPARLGEYVRYFSPAIAGITGTRDEINQAVALFGAKYEIETPDPTTGQYGVSHTAYIYVLDGKGRLRLAWPFDIEAANMKADLQALLAEKP